MSYSNFIVIIRVAVIAVTFDCFFLSAECGRVRRVVGGMEVNCGTQPRVASLRNESSQHLCGATLLTADFAVTAAHCVHDTPHQYQLLLNNYCGETTPKAPVLEVFIHDLYDKFSRAHDIALLRISLDLNDTAWLDDTDVLPTSSFGISGECTIYGYGSKDPQTTESSEKLLAANIMLVSMDDCLETLGPIAPEYNSGMMCAVGNGTDSCQGDSGSPLMCHSLMEGISSHGLSCGVPGVPGVYTSIGAHMRWITDIMTKNNLSTYL